MAILKSESLRTRRKLCDRPVDRGSRGGRGRHISDHTLGISGKHCTHPQTPALGREAHRCHREGVHSKMSRTRRLWDVLFPALVCRVDQFSELFQLFPALVLFFIHPPDLQSPSCTHVCLSLFKRHPQWRPFPIPPSSCDHRWLFFVCKTLLVCRLTWLSHGLDIPSTWHCSSSVRVQVKTKFHMESQLTPSANKGT